MGSKDAGRSVWDRGRSEMRDRPTKWGRIIKLTMRNYDTTLFCITCRPIGKTSHPIYKYVAADGSCSDISISLPSCAFMCDLCVSKSLVIQHY